MNISSNNIFCRSISFDGETCTELFLADDFIVSIFHRSRLTGCFQDGEPLETGGIKLFLFGNDRFHRDMGEGVIPEAHDHLCST